MVHVKEMICIGFKSFRKRTVVKFDKGFTAIVGANGSGKSNIIDAFVFVMGSLSAKQLRADNIKDLISNGGNGLGPASFASVEIIFDNTDNAFAVGGKDVSISRKVNQKGQGVYQINGKRATRTEIIDLLDISGLMPNSSNMIMQGKLFELINMNNVQRRQLIEDIAGISSYNEKKGSAEKELEEIQQNLANIALLLNEVYMQMDELKGEKEDAEKYLKMVEQQKLLQNALNITQINASKGKIETIDDDKTITLNKIEEITKTEQELQAQIKQFEIKLNELRPKILKVQDSELLRMTQEEKKLKTEILELSSKIKYLKKNISDYKTEQKTILDKLQELDEKEKTIGVKLEDLNNKKSLLNTEIDQKSENIHILESELLDNDKKYVEIKNQAKSLQSELLMAKDNTNQQSTKIEVISNEIGGLSKQKEKLEARIFKNNDAIGKYRGQIRNLKQEKQKRLGLQPIDGTMNKSAKNQIENQIKQLENQVVKHQIDISKIKPAFTASQKKMYELQSQIKISRQMNQGSRAIQAIMSAKQKGLIPGIYGTISQLGSTDQKYNTAMSTAAGGKFNYIVVDHPITAENCINYLKEKKMGRASFIPLSSIKHNSFDLYDTHNPSVYGKAVNLIDFDEKYRDAFEFVFGRTVIVKDISTARQLKVPAQRVTLDGDVVSGSNLMTGGQKKNANNNNGFKNNPENDLNEIKGLFEQYKLVIETAEMRIKEIQNEISRLYKLKISANTKTKEFDDKIAGIKAKMEQLTQTIEEDEAEINEILQKISLLTQDKESLGITLQELVGHQNEIQNKIQMVDEELNNSEESDLKKRLKEEERTLKKLQKQANTLEIEITKNTTLLHETIINNRKELQAQLREKEIASNTNQDELSESTLFLHKNEVEIASLKEKIKQKSSILSSLLNEQRELHMEISNRKTKIGVIGNQIHPLKLQLNTADMKMQELQSKIDEWKCKVVRDIVVPEEMLTINPHVHKNKLEQLTQDITQMGAINLRAIDKYSEIESRFESLEKKNEQVVNEREAIIDFIEALETEKKKVFLHTYNSINANFAFIFGKLSPGGEAKLNLENMEDPFEGGMQILARPGEKKWCQTQAMSGGEKTLTIIALILGIQMHVPSPYYVLDEIDAALDDVNAALVADMIKELSEKSQFIIITHRDVTMARVDQLLGVSNTAGITSVLNVSISQVLGQINNAETEVSA